ncbi:hypothetical protein ACQPX6_17530 [Actinomycetospora sp. CA-101289]|uniref:hypothetical protein n=1 Tax=Actinomycetospora sp. CA-101289 TaxID=3239893 RepID=UPI003D9621DB
MKKVRLWAIVLVSVMLTGVSVGALFGLGRPTEAIAAILAYLPLNLVSVMAPFAARLESDALAEKAAEASVKCYVVGLFGLALGTTLVVAPLPIAQSGPTWFVASLVGVSCWSLAVEIAMLLFWHGRTVTDD